ncbi:hypothetical protein [Lacinutrix algicola]|uniref:hypothetical protein n=1 Tax=Lacinutrix algicola TaxID=342954 RepID=UPI0006E229D9|nr:hypothetical protein [Lacinutrix algicola]
MKTSKKIFSLILFALIGLVSVSCSEDDESTYLYAGEGDYIYGFQEPSTRFSYFEDLGTITRDIPVIFLGGNDGSTPANGVVITYEINEALSTAVEGNEFDFLDTSGSFTIPAGGLFTNFQLAVNTGNFSPTEATTLVIDLMQTSTAGTTVSDLNRTVTVSFIGCQSELDSSSYGVVVTRDDNSVYNHGTETLFSPSVNTFVTTTTGLWPAGDYTATQGFTFVDVCGVLTVEPQGLFEGAYSNQVYTENPGSVDASGNFTITYAVTFDGEPTYYTAVYTKL